MASNFHNVFGLLIAGADVHEGPIVPLLTPGLCLELVFAHPFILGPNQKPSVKINGVNSVVDLHTSYLLWLHVPVTPTNILWPLDFVFGSQQCWLPRSTVQICGELSTCCIAGPVSINLDCWEWAMIPSDVTFQYATVQTTPSLSDFLYGAVRALVNGAVSAVTNLGFKGLGKIKIGKTPISKFTENWTDKLGNALVKKGMGYKFARALGKPFMSRALGNVSRQKMSGASWAAGRRIVNAFIGKVLPGSASSVVDTALNGLGFDPGTALAQKIAGVPPGQKPAGLFKPDPGKTATGKIPFYNAAQGGLQFVGDP